MWQSFFFLCLFVFQIDLPINRRHERLKNEINILFVIKKDFICLGFVPFFKIYVKKCLHEKQYFDKNEITSLSKYSLKTKELLDFVLSLMYTNYSESGEFPRIIEIDFFVLFSKPSLYYQHQKNTLRKHSRKSITVYSFRIKIIGR